MFGGIIILKMFIVYLKFKFNQMHYALCGNPRFNLYHRSLFYFLNIRQYIFISIHYSLTIKI